MTVQELREALAAMPDHWPVHVENLLEPGQGIEYLYALDCVQHNFPSQGNIAVIRINHDPK